MILAHICFEVLPENRELFIRTANDVTRKSETEEGCLVYRYMADLEDENRFYITELWSTKETLDAHLAQPHTKSTMETLGPISKPAAMQIFGGEMKALELPF